MRRTAQERARRALLAEAASGGPRERLPAGIARVRVVLYDCQPAPRDAQPLTSHRAFAEARDWSIVAELVDVAPPGTPAMALPLWPHIAELIDSGQADGIVTSAWTTTDEDLLSWLLDRHAFAACIGPMPDTPATRIQTPAAVDTTPGPGQPDGRRVT
ncbi:hypothetical protein ACFWGL_17220 [Streptomyces sp. NPDC060286]|uniref:hypothetical protein n=1 Tax=unclassified Streptomyces TaxID=2593676 RepID=UPI0035D95EFC